MRMNVCYAVETGSRMAGSQQSLLNLINEEVKKGINPYIVTRTNWEILDIAKEKGLKAVCIPSTRTLVKNNSINIKDKLKYPIKRVYNIKNMRKAIRFIKENNIELVHINSLLAGTFMAEAALKCGIPYIYHIREFLEEDHELEFIDKERVYGLVSKAEKVIAISNAVKQKYEKILKREIELIYNGLPLEDNYNEYKPKFDKDIIELLITGRIVESKGQLDAVKAVEYLINERNIKNIRLTIIGYRGVSDYEIKLKKYVKDNNLYNNILIIDYTYELKEIKKTCDIGLICSSAEAFGRVTIENMLAGLLMIGANSGGTLELIEDGTTGLLYQVGNYISLAEKIEYAILNSEKMNNIIKHGQKNAIKNYIIENTSEKVYRLYKDVL